MLNTPLTPALRDKALEAALAQRPASGVRLWRLDGAGIVVQTPRAMLYVDPFIAPHGAPGWVRRVPQVIARLPRPDVVIATHEHDDHTDPVALAQLQAYPDLLFAAPAPAVELAAYAGFPRDRIRTLTVGDVVEAGDIRVTAVPVTDDDSREPLAYVIQAAGRTIYHGGDAQTSPLFKHVGVSFDIDWCCLSVAGTYNGQQFYLTPEQAVEAARALRAGVLIPIHWDLWTINGIPESEWSRLPASTPSLDIRLLAPGQHLDG